MRRNYQTAITTHEPRMKAGSALILAVVLTSLLAIVGVLFVLTSRVEKIATEATAENRELNLAIDTVIAAISQELVRDTPGVAGQEYYDYPDSNDVPGVNDDAWLSVLEPYDDAGTYKWRHITDLYDKFKVPECELAASIVPDYQDPLGMIEGLPADADGDGVTDSRWVIIPDVTSSKGAPIFAAIRVIDSGGMANVNTARQFDPNAADPNLIDGSSQMQINFLALAARGSTADPLANLDGERFGSEPFDLDAYLDDVVRCYRVPAGKEYTPFDMSDELELRNRFLLNHPDIDTRVEELWDNAFQVGKQVPFSLLDFPGGITAPGCDWFERAYGPFTGASPLYSYRHLATIYNMDRIIDPNGDKMININDGNIPVALVYDRLLRSMRPALVPDPNIRWRLERECAQLAVNIIDFADDDTDVTILTDPCGIDYYGFDAQPFITELGMYFVVSRDYELNLDYYVLELYNPFDRFIDLNDFVLELYDPKTSQFVDIPFPGVQIPPNDGNDLPYFVIVNDIGALGHFSIPLGSKVDRRLRFFSNWVPPDKSKPVVDFRENPDKSLPPIYFGWKNSYILYLKRIDIPGPPIYVDQQIIDPTWIIPAMSAPAAFGRDIRDWHVIYQNPETLVQQVPPTFGLWNFFDPNLSLAHNFSFFLPNPLRPRSRLVTVGDIPRILTIGHSTFRIGTIGELLGSRDLSQEAEIRLDLQNPYHRDIFQYLTVFDPTSDNIDNDGDGKTDPNDRSEWKIPGRININTAPWYVIAQLPWLSDRRPLVPLLTHELAKEIVKYRDMVVGGFESIGELNFVGLADPNALRSIAFYARNDGPAAGDQIDFPDLTPGDEVIDDFEERDVIFSRISNLVTVRSDVFTAYILVRIGTDGPQKRVIAILDRSGVYTGKAPVRLVALHDVPDPR